jgi:hypothetical protein
MNRAVRTGWSPAAWILGGALIFGAEAALFLRVGRWPSTDAARRGPPSRWAMIATREQAAQAESNWLFGDPVVFARPDGRGFSGAVLRMSPKPNYDLAEFSGAPGWLGVGSSLAIGPLPRAEAQVTAWPVVRGGLAVETPALADASWVEWRGARPGWRLEIPDAPTSIPVDEVVPPTFVEVGINALGGVVWSRLSGAKGNATAEDAALSTARQAVFHAPGERPPRVEPEAVVGTEELIFHWRTAPASR